MARDGQGVLGIVALIAKATLYLDPDRAAAAAVRVPCWRSRV